MKLWQVSLEPIIREQFLKEKIPARLTIVMAFTNTLVSSTKNMHRMAYIKWQVKAITYYLTTKKEV
jgi:hypothetical protein